MMLRHIAEGTPSPEIAKQLDLLAKCSEAASEAGSQLANLITSVFITFDAIGRFWEHSVRDKRSSPGSILQRPIVDLEHVLPDCCQPISSLRIPNFFPHRLPTFIPGTWSSLCRYYTRITFNYPCPETSRLPQAVKIESIYRQLLGDLGAERYSVMATLTARIDGAEYASKLWLSPSSADRLKAIHLDCAERLERLRDRVDKVHREVADLEHQFLSQQATLLQKHARAWLSRHPPQPPTIHPGAPSAQSVSAHQGASARPAGSEDGTTEKIAFPLSSPSRPLAAPNRRKPKTRGDSATSSTPQADQHRPKPAAPTPGQPRIRWGDPHDSLWYACAAACTNRSNADLGKVSEALVNRLDRARSGHGSSINALILPEACRRWIGHQQKYYHDTSPGSVCWTVIAAFDSASHLWTICGVGHHVGKRKHQNTYRMYFAVGESTSRLHTIKLG
ncbi:MAG: hypothetical protein AAF550_12745 [Myxococcota bacterium]